MGKTIKEINEAWQRFTKKFFFGVEHKKVWLPIKTCDDQNFHLEHVWVKVSFATPHHAAYVCEGVNRIIIIDENER